MGDRWERELAKELDGKRQPSSGAFGTLTNRSSLTGDVVTRYPWWNKPLHIECKYGYGGSKSMSIKREWIEKVRKESQLNHRYPILAIKFRDVTSGDLASAKVICIDLETWKDLMQEIEYLYLEYLALLEKQFNATDNPESL